MSSSNPVEAISGYLEHNEKDAALFRTTTAVTVIEGGDKGSSHLVSSKLEHVANRNYSQLIARDEPCSDQPSDSCAR